MFVYGFNLSEMLDISDKLLLSLNTASVNGIKITLIKQRTLVDATHDWEEKDRSSVSNQCRESQEAKGINKDRPKIYLAIFDHF